MDTEVVAGPALYDIIRGVNPLKKYIGCATVSLMLLVGAGTLTGSGAGESKEFVFSRNDGVSSVRPVKHVKIKLKRLANGTYVWELTGDNAEEVMRVDTMLRKYMKDNGLTTK